MVTVRRRWSLPIDVGLWVVEYVGESVPTIWRGPLFYGCNLLK